MTRRKHEARFGSVISGTLRPEDTIPAFIDELRRITGRVPHALYRQAQRALKADSDDAGDHEVANSLIEALSEHAPPYAYFGSHEGDGSDFGFWLGAGALDDFDGKRVADLSEVPADYSGEVLHSNDHGNLSLYSCIRGELREIWSLA